MSREVKCFHSLSVEANVAHGPRPRGPRQVQDLEHALHCGETRWRARLSHGWGVRRGLSVRGLWVPPGFWMTQVRGGIGLRFSLRFRLEAAAEEKELKVFPLWIRPINAEPSQSAGPSSSWPSSNKGISHNFAWFLHGADRVRLSVLGDAKQ